MNHVDIRFIFQESGVCTTHCFSSFCFMCFLRQGSERMVREEKQNKIKKERKQFEAKNYY